MKNKSVLYLSILILCALGVGIIIWQYGSVFNKSSENPVILSSRNVTQPANQNIQSSPCGPEPPVECAANTSLSCAEGKWECRSAEKGGKISDWKTYSNEKYGFEMKYPFLENMKIIDNNDSVDFQYASKENNSILVSAFDLVFAQNTEKLSLQEWFDKKIDNKGTLKQAGVFELSNLPSGYEVYKMEEVPIPDAWEEGHISTYAFVISPSRNYVISLGLSQTHELDLYGYDTLKKQNALLDQILSTFKFLDEDAKYKQCTRDEDCVVVKSLCGNSQCMPSSKECSIGCDNIKVINKDDQILWEISKKDIHCVSRSGLLACELLPPKEFYSPACKNNICEAVLKNN